MLQRFFLPNENTKTLATAAIFFDFDDVLHDPQRSDPDNKGSYVVGNDGSLLGGLIDREKLRELIAYAINYDIPLYIVTARPQTHKKYIISVINEVDGINELTVGGFKEKNIFCLGIEKYDETLKRPHVASLIRMKVDQIIEVHMSELSHLPKNHVLFSDDELRNLEPVANAEYTTVLAKGKADSSHFSALLDHLKSLQHCEAIRNIPGRLIVT